MVEVTKNLENRHLALKWMYTQGKTGFLIADVMNKFHVPTSFIAAAGKKNITKANGRLGTTYIGPEPSIKLAVEVFDFERQRLGRKSSTYPTKMIEVDGLDKFKEVVENAQESIVTKAIESQCECKQLDKSIKKSTVASLNITIENGKVTMNWKDFSKLMEEYNG